MKMKSLLIFNVLITTSMASVLFPVNTDAYQNLGNGSICRALPAFANLLNPASLLVSP